MHGVQVYVPYLVYEAALVAYTSLYPLLTFSSLVYCGRVSVRCSKYIPTVACLFGGVARQSDWPDCRMTYSPDLGGFLPPIGSFPLSLPDHSTFSFALLPLQHKQARVT